MTANKIQTNRQQNSVTNKIQGNMAKSTNEVNDFSKYDVIFIGFPVWYHTMSTFVQDYVSKCNLKSKRVIPFLTANVNGKESLLKAAKILISNFNITDRHTSSLKKEDEDAWLNSIVF